MTVYSILPLVTTSAAVSLTFSFRGNTLVRQWFTALHAPPAFRVTLDKILFWEQRPVVLANRGETLWVFQSPF